MEILKAEIDELIRKRNEEEANLQSASSRPDYDRIQNRIVEINAEIADKQSQLAAAEAQETVFNQFENLDFGGGMILSLREVCASEEYYQLLSMWMQNYIGDQAQKHAAIVNSYKSEIESREETIDALNAEVNRLNDQIDELNEVVASTTRLQLVIDDLNAKRDSAGEQLAEVKEEVERLTKDNESLRKQLEGQNAPATPQVDPAELYARIQAAKPGIYNKRWATKENGLEDRRYFAANLSTTGEEITIPLLEIGKYREESQEEAERFRAEKAAEEAARLAEESVPKGIEPPPLKQFPGEEDADISTGEGSALDGTLDDAPVTQAQIRAIEDRLQRLEQQTIGRAVA